MVQLVVCFSRKTPSIIWWLLIIRPSTDISFWSRHQTRSISGKCIHILKIIFEVSNVINLEHKNPKQLTTLMCRSIYLIELSLYNRINQNNFFNDRFSINLSKMRVAPEFFFTLWQKKWKEITNKPQALMVPWFSLSDL